MHAKNEALFGQYFPDSQIPRPHVSSSRRPSMLLLPCLLVLFISCCVLSSAEHIPRRTRLLNKSRGQVIRSLPSAPPAALSTRRSVDIIMALSGGDDTSPEKWSMRRQVIRNLLGVWGVAQVISVLANAVKRLAPVAMQPLQHNDLQAYQWALYVGWSGYMVYAEGYKGFQKKFSPMVVQRAFDLINHPSILNILLAGPYCMGMFNASRKRMIVSWSITAGVFSLVKLVKLLPYPYRAIVDAGVVLGLSYGALSILVLTIKALLGGKVIADEEEAVTKAA